MTKYERLVIKPIFDIIEKYQKYLTQPENLPQLAKIGYIYNKLYYAGRVAYGYEGIVKKGNTCEANPKDWLEGVNYLNKKIDYLVYDAWAMHVSNDGNILHFDEIKNIVFNGKPLTEFEIKKRTPNKTFDQWVDVLTDKQYKYHSLFPNRIKVADYLLCVIGTGFGYNKTTGCIIEEAGGADQDIDLYGDWENSTFSPEIKPIIEKIFQQPEVKVALDSESEYVKSLRINKQKEEQKSWKVFYTIVNKERKEKGLPKLDDSDPNTLPIIRDFINAEITKIEDNNQPTLYYPISIYSIITLFDENTHISYINAGIEVCKDILSHKEDYSIKNDVDYNRNVTFAKKFLKKFNENR